MNSRLSSINSFLDEHFPLFMIKPHIDSSSKKLSLGLRGISINLEQANFIKKGLKSLETEIKQVNSAVLKQDLNSIYTQFEKCLESNGFSSSISEPTKY